VAISSGNPFGESRLVSLVTPLGSNEHGMQMTVEGAALGQNGGPTFWIAPDTVHHTTLYVARGGLPVYDFEDIELLVKPKCAVGDYWEADHVFDSVAMEFHYRKPISPITLSADLGSKWFINNVDTTDTEQAVFKLSDYDVEQLTHSLKEIVLEYKRDNELYWTRMTDASLDQEVLGVDTLLWYYNKFRNTYPEPKYPFVWEIPFDFLDGGYQVRAMVVHENGSIAYSNILSGTVDRTHPWVSETPAPADGLLAQADAISISFSELIDVPTFLTDANNISVSVLAEGTFAGTTLNEDDYAVAANKNKVSLVLTDEILTTYDGRTVEVTITGIQDMVGNVSTPVDTAWSFQIDFLKQTPSPVTLSGPDPLWITTTTSADDLMIDMIISDYDVYEASFSLSDIALQHRHADSATWVESDSKMLDGLQARYRQYLSAGDLPVDTLQWDATGLADGTYELRAVTTGATQLNFISGIHTALIDRTAPTVFGTPEP
ncbi:MAG TPA: hypothetical protein DCP28_35805, partial [Cytophagales bacterium]|nr:hypothetical protein [Cytophagales bacterium]